MDINKEEAKFLYGLMDAVFHFAHVASVEHVEVLTHNKISNVYNDDGDVDDGGRSIEENISIKNRSTLLLKCLISVLNGANVEGVGTLVFDNSAYSDSKASMKLSNNHNYYGFEFVMSVMMAGDGYAENG